MQSQWEPKLQGWGKGCLKQLITQRRGKNWESSQKDFLPFSRPVIWRVLRVMKRVTPPKCFVTHFKDLPLTLLKSNV